MNYKKQKEVKIDNKSTHLKWFAVIFLILILLLVFRIFWLQFIDGSFLKERAYKQITANRVLSPKRGTIYDATGKNILAVSSTVETVTVNPGNINQKDKEKVAKELSELFDLNYDTVLKKVTKRSSIETIVKKVEKEKTDELRIWMQENNIITGINMDEDTKRYYP